MVRKKIDNRIRVLIENGVETGHRSMIVVVGDKGRDQVPILHHMASKAKVRARPNVLWCYSKDLAFSSHRNKKMKHLQKKIKTAKIDVNEDDPFELFVASTNIRYCYYKQTDKILGQTFGMCVLQDFESLTPNILARTMETVEGGGVVVILLKTVTSLKQLYTMTMDVHTRYRTEAHQEVVGRFNERFILSLASNKSCIVIDDSLNNLPISSHVKNLTEVPKRSSEAALTKEEVALNEVKDKFRDSQPTGSLLNLCKTLDQAKAVLEFVDAITDKKLDRTVSLTAARGRGKSAALGLAVAAAVGFGYSNIFVTSPTPENLGTLFDFLFKGFDAMGYEEHTDYDIVQSTNTEFNNAIVRVNIHEQNERAGGHRQTIQYLHPSDAQKLGQAELVVIDEAAAIPLPTVKQLLGPYLVFMSSTINGYEGTGRSLSLKLLEQLRKQSAVTSSCDTKTAAQLTFRTLREVTLEESIRYKPGDAAEGWLNRLLCLDASSAPAIGSGCPLPQDCDLYYVNRDTLFSYHKASEAFLQRIVSIFVSSHYKNTPNDLQMMSDAPAHHIFVLLGPTTGSESLPEVLCAVQVCLEGEISKKSIMHGLSRGKRADGDLIPWSMAQQFQDENFPGLSGARIVRIATHPGYQRMGYGKRAIELLQRYYELKVPSLGDEEDDEDKDRDGTGKHSIARVEEEDVTLMSESVTPRDDLPPLLLRLNERKPERLDYLGVSYGLTQELLRFWKGCGFTPTYLRQTANDLTGEHTTIMLKLLDQGEEFEEPRWLADFWRDFRRRIVNLLGFEFRKFTPSLALSILSNKNQSKEKTVERLSEGELSKVITPFDLRRLELFCNNMADYHLVMDLMPTLARLYFLNQLCQDARVSAMQEAILVGLGLQCKSVKVLSAELDLPQNQILGLFNRMVRKHSSALKGVAEEAIARKVEVPKGLDRMRPLHQTMDDELEEAAEETKQQEKKKKQASISKTFGNLEQYEIKGDDDGWAKALGGKGTKALVSVKSGEKRKNGAVNEAETDENTHGAKKQKKKDKKGKSKKKSN